jgi:hypothetical protein
VELVMNDLGKRTGKILAELRSSSCINTFIRSKETPAPHHLSPGLKPDSYLRGYSLLLPPAVITAYLGKWFLGGGPAGRGELRFFDWFFWCSPLLVMYVLVALYFLAKRQCPEWVKVVEVFMAFIILVPLLLCSGFVLFILIFGINVAP